MNRVLADLYMAPTRPGPDRVLAGGVLVLLLFGLVMVTSASLQIAESHMGQPFHYSMRQAFHIVLGVSVATFIFMFFDMDWLQRMRFLLLPLILMALIVVFIPGLGYEVNGSQRWVKLGPLTFQPSELVKPGLVLYMASYITQRQQALATSWKAFLMPLAVYGVISVLLLLEPKFSSVVVLGIVVMGMLFMAGVPLGRYFLVAFIALGIMVGLAFSQPYRVERLMSFTDPWQHPFGIGYQLTQSLIAYGQGGLFGAGLGRSIQKLFYLPEAHTDFIHAVIAEELGLVGNLFVIGLYTLVYGRMFWLARGLDLSGRRYSAYVIYGIALILATQTFVNLGVSMGILPTTGVTLPFISYGGSSLVTSMIMIGLVLRAAAEPYREETKRRAAA